MPVFDYDGVPIAYDRAGSGEPIVFLHNLGGDRHIWAQQMRALSATNTVYALDLLGYGESGSPATGYTVDNYLRMLTRFLREHKADRITLAGNCFGSALSLLYARKAPRQVRALVLCNPLTANTLRPTAIGRLARAAAVLPLDSLAGALRLPGPAAGLIVREQLGPRGRAMTPDTFAGLRHRWSEPRRLYPPAAIARDLPRLAVLDHFRPGPGFPPITTIWGAKNRILSAAAGARLATTLHPVRAVELPDCGHLPMLESPGTVTAAIASAAGATLADQRPAGTP